MIPSAMVPSVIGLAKLGKLSFDGADLAPIWQQLTGRLSEGSIKSNIKGNISGDGCAALLDMCVIAQMQGSPERGLQFQAAALEHCRLYQIPANQIPANQIPAKTQPPRLTVLGFVTQGKINANTPIEFLLEDSSVTLLLLYIVPGKPLPPIPAHDAAIVLAADSEAAGPVLLELERLTEHWPCPVLNRPGQIPEAGRERLHCLLSPIAGVTMPATVRRSREALAACGFPSTEFPSIEFPSIEFPLIVRPLDSHAGDGLEKLEGADSAEIYLQQRPEPEFFVSPFQDYRSADGLYRKYRIMLVGGRAFPCHMAISEHWMIHYVNAGMAESAEKRCEEAQFMDSFDTGFGLRHRRPLAEIAEALNLDYFGIDCAEMPDGTLLVFEAGTALVVHAMDPPDIFPYKARHTQAIVAALMALLFRQ